MRTRLVLALALAVIALFGMAPSPAPVCHGPFYADGTWNPTTFHCDNAYPSCPDGEEVHKQLVTVSGQTCTVKYVCCKDYQP
jgi:hypothetical protein